jgi:hypothetical protein
MLKNNKFQKIILREILKNNKFQKLFYEKF